MNSRLVILENLYGSFCEENKFSFSVNDCILSPDDTTLFCTSGMHNFKSYFSDKTYKNTFTNIQSCLRMNDLIEIGDTTHYLLFHMLGFFSFRQKSVPEIIDFWMSFLESINLKPDFVTIHPDKINKWKTYYLNYKVDIKPDTECFWSDGNIGGYSTEFYKNGIEIGNIVNTLEDCIDVGFGGERILNLLGLTNTLNKKEILIETIESLLLNNVELANKQHGYVLKKLITLLIYEKGFIEHPYYHKLFNQQKSKWNFYINNKSKSNFVNKSSEWWLDTHGVNLKNLDIIDFLNS